MSSHAPPEVAPPRPGGRSGDGPGGPVLGEDDLGRHARAADDEAAGRGAGDGAHLRLDEGSALAAGARDGHGVAAGGHGEIAGGVAESHTGRDDLAVHADVGLADLGRHVDRPEGGLAGLDAVVLVHEQVDALVGAHGDHGVLAGAEADDLARDRRRLAVQDKSEACLSWTKDLVATGLCEGGRKPRTALLNQQGGGSGACDGVQETDLSLVRLRLRRHSRYYDRGEGGCSERRALLGCASLHLVMLTREREIGRSLQKADPQDRALLDLSLRRKVKDDVVAAVLRLQPEEVVHRRAAALDRLAADLGHLRPCRTRQVVRPPRRAPGGGVAGRHGRRQCPRPRRPARLRRVRPRPPIRPRPPPSRPQPTAAGRSPRRPSASAAAAGRCWPRP